VPARRTPAVDARHAIDNDAEHFISSVAAFDGAMPDTRGERQMAESLAGRVALVTGASSGIGEAVALALAAAGVRVAITARRGDRLDALTQRIASGGGEALALPGDVCDAAFAAATVADTVTHFGRLDILVNSAGMIQAGGVAASDLDEYRRVFDLNLMATLYTCKAAIGPMKAQRSGDIINISSLAATKSGPAFSAYAASKHALNSMSDGLRQEVGGDGIRVSIVMPGATRTEVFDNISNAQVRESIKAHVDKDGAMAPADVADAVLLIVGMPRRTNVSMIAIRPTIDTTA
jgi:NADP-dependent 3-hydroxy acid dehydrogenase YdfG